MSEPLGALLALLVLKPVFGMQPEHLDSVLCVVAGIMTGVSFQELVPHVRASNPVATHPVPHSAP